MSRFLSRQRLSFLVLFALFLTANMVHAQGGEKPATPEKITTVEGITEYRLANGVRALLFPDPSSSNVTVNMTVYVGSRHEGYGETGMAHLLEHMLFKGTPTFPNVPQVLNERGADFNGTTWVDRTNYYETMRATDENLEFGIKLEADRLMNSYVKREDLLKEFTVVRSEFEANENNPRTILNQRIMAVAFEWHNYGKSTIGNRTDIERVPIDRLQSFYRKYYRPDNILLVVAGKFEPDKALNLISKYFGALKNSAGSIEATYTEEPAQDGERIVMLRRVGKVPVVGVVYHTPAGAHPDTAALEVLRSVMLTPPSGRLYKALVETKKAASVSGDVSHWHDPGVIEFSASVSDQSTPEEVRDVMFAQLERLAGGDITAEEVERATRRYLAERERTLTRSHEIAVELSEWAGAGDWRLLFLQRDRVAKVTPEDVTRVARKYLIQSNRTVGIFVPTAAKEIARITIPETPNVASLVKDYKGGKAPVLGEAFDPTPQNIDRAVERHQLANGHKVAFLPKRTRGETVVASLTLHFGNEKSLLGQRTAAKMLGSLMTRGTKKHTRQQLQDELDKLKSKISAGSDLGEVTFAVTSDRKHLPATLALLGEMLREPTFPETEFDVLKRSRIQALEKASVEPGNLIFQALTRALNPYAKDDVRYVPTIPEAIETAKQLKKDDIVKLYTEQLGAQSGELILIGDFDPSATLKQVETLLGDWKSPMPYARIKQSVPNLNGARQRIDTPDKENAFFVAAHLVEMNDTDANFPALLIGNYILGGGPLTSRLADRVRQKDGLSYQVGSDFNADAQDKYGKFMMIAICNPKNIDKLDQAILDEMNQLLKAGVKTEELGRAKKAYLEDLKTARGDDHALAAMLSEVLYVGRTFAYYGDLEKNIARLSVEEVNSALRNHLSSDRLIIFRAGDFSKNKDKK
jgi:zinc protease